MEKTVVNTFEGLMILGENFADDDGFDMRVAKAKSGNAFPLCLLTLVKARSLKAYSDLQRSMTFAQLLEPKRRWNEMSSSICLYAFPRVSKTRK